MRNGIFNKSLIFVFLCIITLGILPSCSRVNMLDITTSRDDKAFREMLDKVLVALDSKDKEGLKELFAISAIKKNSDIDNQIDSFFKIYTGPSKIEHIHLSLSGGESIEHGKRKTGLSGGGKDIIITAGGVQYYVSMMMYSHDDFNKDNEGIHTLEFDTDDAHNSQYFKYYNEVDDGPGLYYQHSAKKRDDIRWIQGNSWKYTYYKRELAAEKLRSAAEKSDDFNNFVTFIGKPNCSWTVYGYYYYELNNGLFAVCKLDNDVRPRDSSGYAVKPNSIVAIYIADDKDDLETIWTADDIVKVNGEYRYFKPSNKKPSEEFFKAFASRSHSFKQLTKEIGQPNVDRVTVSQFYYYYKISDNRFVGLDYSGEDNIDLFFVVDSDKKLYTIWEAKSSSD